MEENKPLYVVDASVMLKWFFDDEIENQEEAQCLWNDFLHQNIEFAIPQYAFAEMLNILARAMPIPRALACISRLIGPHIYQYPITLELASLACGIMERIKSISFYDAGYHAIAFYMGGFFITADEKYYRKTHREGAIMLLKDYGKRR